jgi:hypothetical protein
MFFRRQRSSGPVTPTLSGLLGAALAKRANKKLKAVRS